MTVANPISLPDARFGAAAMRPGTSELPAVFPREMGPNTMRYLGEVVESGLTSDMVQRFEHTLAKYHGRRFCVSAPGCTAALFALFLGVDFRTGDEIIVSPIADYGDLSGLLFENYIPVFGDVDRATGLITAETIEPHITPRTRAILAVNFFGLPCDFDPIMSLARKHDLLVIEDCCQSILATYKGRLAGTLAHVSAFSFDSEKTCGADMGGALLLDDEKLYERIINRAHARGAKVVPGFGRTHFYRGASLRMPQCTAATCLANWEILPRQIKARQQSAAMLDQRLRDVPGIRTYAVPSDRAHTYWLYGFQADPAVFRCSIEQLASEFRQAGIPDAGLGMYYLMPEATPFLEQLAREKEYPFSCPPASQPYSYSAENVPNAKAFLSNWIRWFWTEKYEASHVERMADIIRQVCERNLR